MLNITLTDWREARKYIIKRLLNTFIREQISVFKNADIFEDKFGNSFISICIADKRLYLPVDKAHFLQRFQATCPSWYVGGQVKKCSNIIALMRVLYQQYHIDDFQNIQLAIKEYKTAVLQYIYNHQALLKPKSQFVHSMLYYDHVASFLDHPLYPTARAKLGFNAPDLIKYAPEYSNSFELNWIAIEKLHVYHTGLHFSFWPQPKDLGFTENMAVSYAFIPIHPFALANAINILEELNINYFVSKKTYLKVLPTLSIRTLVLEKSPDIHIKLPLNIRTLSAKNLRTIKPSTITDGAIIQKMLTKLVCEDEALNNKVEICDESTGGHVNNISDLGYIIRSFPKYLIDNENEIIFPVAALCANEGNTLVINNIAQSYFNNDVMCFLEKYIEIMLSVHLRLVLRYGIALEANQQNSLIILNTKTKELKLLLKDNDAPRIDTQKLLQASPNVFSMLSGIQDQRIIEANQKSLFKMFSTIIFQLNIACVIEKLIETKTIGRDQVYQLLVKRLNNIDEDSSDALIHYIKHEEYIDIKYLYTSGTFLPKSATSIKGDINKFYGKTVNFLKESALIAE